jgi:hypothetical protein
MILFLPKACVPFTSTMAQARHARWADHVSRVDDIPYRSCATNARRQLAEAATPVPVVTATPQSQVAPTPLASPTPAPGQICVQAYNDLNGDGQQSTDESLLAGVAFTLSDASGPRDSYTTDSATEPYCFKDLPPGSYQLTIKPPTNYASTTPNAITISLSGGMKVDVAHGARRSGPAPIPTGSTSGSATSGGLLGSTGRTVLIVIGVLLLICANRPHAHDEQTLRQTVIVKDLPAGEEGYVAQSSR